MSESGIVIPPIVSATVTAALTHRHAIGGLPGVTRTAALTAVELAQAPITSRDVVQRVADWHARHPDHTTPDGRSTPLAGIWGGRAGRDWALEMTGKMAAARTAAAQMTGGMIALMPDDPESVALPDGDPPDQLHLTLAYVAEDAQALDEATTQAITAAADAGASVRSDPLMLSVIGFGTLGDADPPASVLFLQQSDGDGTDHQDGAAAVAGAVRSVLDDYGSEAFPPEHDSFIPHLSVGYGLPVESLRPFVGQTLTFSAGVSIVLGGERMDRPWSGGRTAAIEEPLDIIRTIPPNKRRARLKRLSSKVNTINRDLRAKLAAGAEVAMADGLHRAGVKVVQRASKRARTVQASVAACEHGVYPSAVMAAAGITEQDALAHAFDSYGTKADRWITTANTAKRRAFVDELDYAPDDPALVAASSRWDAAKDVAVGFLLSSLTALAIDRLTNGPLEPDTRGEQVEGDVPLSLVGQAMAMADGRPVSGPGSEGPGPLGAGETTVDQFGGGIVLDLVVNAEPDAALVFTWVWGGGGATGSFPPHEALDGTSATVDDMADVWANSEDWPDGDTYFPLDHAGCSCDLAESWDVADSGEASDVSAA